MRLAFLTQNLPLKLFAIFVALILFLFVSVESATPIDADFPIEYRTADDIMITSDAPSKINTTLRGPWAAFRSLMFSEVEPVVVELEDAEPGRVRHRIDTDDIAAPAGMQVVSIRPSEVEVSLDRRVEKTVLVEVSIPEKARPAFGFKIAGWRAEPPEVRLVGPKTKVQDMTYIYTRPLDLTDHEEDTTVTVELRPPEHPVRLAERNSVRVTVEIVEELSQRNFTLPVQLANAPEGTRFAPETVTVTLRGPQRIVDRLEKDSLHALVDVEAELAQRIRSFSKPVEIGPEIPERSQVEGLIPQVEVILPPVAHRRRGQP